VPPIPGNAAALYDPEAIDDDPDFNQASRFPCTSFTVIRQKEGDFVTDILCGRAATTLAFHSGMSEMLASA
jgi:hypothetical protein